MYAVISCRKYAAQTLKLADVGDVTKEQALERMGGWKGFECPICGPCSHVELDFRGYFTIHGELHDTEEAATVAMWELYDSRPDDFRCEGPARLSESESPCNS